MRPLISYILLLAVLLPTISPWGTIAYYHANRDYIAKALCENRSRPELHCDGKCYLAKKLKAQQDKQDKDTTERVQNTPTIQLFCELGCQFDLTPISRLVTIGHSFTYVVAAIARPLDGLFRPPRL
jgi:hypothetical protein